MFGGAQLIFLGGSFYYLAAGLALAFSAYQLWQGNPSGSRIYGALLASTVAWALFESGTNLCERHGMTSIGYFSPQDLPLADNTLVYIIAHSRREAAKTNWEAFAEESQRDGRIIEKIERTFLEPTDYSQLK
jgi:hypothetical protein